MTVGGGEGVREEGNSNHNADDSGGGGEGNWVGGRVEFDM